MSQQEAIKLFDSKRIRTVWDEDQEKWFFSIVDVIAVLTESANPRTYWKVLKNRLAKEGNESVTNCNQLKLQEKKISYRCSGYRANLAIDTICSVQESRAVQVVVSACGTRAIEPTARPGTEYSTSIAGL